MEWVETTGRTVEAALDAALDELGVDEEEVEYEVVDEGRAGLFGRREARIRARVKPVSREKPDDRRRRGGQSGGGGGNRSRSGRGGRSGSGGNRRSGGGGGQSTQTGPKSRPDGAKSGAAAEGSGSGSSSSSRRRRRGGRGRGGGGGNGPSERSNDRTTEEHSVTETDVPVEDQARAAEDFVQGLLEAFGADAAVAIVTDDESILVDVTGEDVGLLVGPKGATLQAIEELVRTVVQRRTEGHGVRINVDVGGYRAKRREALEQFANQLAEKAKETGRDQALEPMSALDRKTVHDAIAPLEGVSTISEGEEPRRRVVVRPG
jgi:spoIIIJ-associated protein